MSAKGGRHLSRVNVRRASELGWFEIGTSLTKTVGVRRYFIRRRRAGGWDIGRVGQAPAHFTSFDAALTEVELRIREDTN